MVSMGLVRNLDFIKMIKSMLQESLQYDKNGVEDLQTRSVANKNHKLNNQIDRRIRQQIERLNEFAYQQPMEALKKSDQREEQIKLQVLRVENMARDKVSLELLAFYLLFVRFCEKEKHKSVQELNKPKFYMDSIELLAKAHWGHESAQALEETCFNVAYQIQEQIR